MKTIYTSLLARLEAEVPELKWIDLDKGQMFYDRPPVLFPAALIQLQMPKATNLNSTLQECDVLITIRLCFDFTGETSNITPQADRDNSLAYFDLKQKVYEKLQGWSTTEMNALKRVNEHDEPRNDAYKVSTISFTTAYHDSTATP